MARPPEQFSRGLNAFDSFVEEAVLEAVDDAELHRRTQRFYEFAHQGDYKFLDFEKLKETHFVRGQRQDVARGLPPRMQVHQRLSVGHGPPSQVPPRQGAHPATSW